MRYIILPLLGLWLIYWYYSSIKELIKSNNNGYLSTSTLLWLILHICALLLGIMFLCEKYW